MKAVTYRQHGGPDVLQLDELPDPHPGPSQAVIAIKAAAVNRYDLILREGPAYIAGFSFPQVPGMDVAGEVIGIGSEVVGLDLGDRVVLRPNSHCGRCEPCSVGDHTKCTSNRFLGGNVHGGYAEQCVVEATHAFAIPDHVSFVQAAALPTSLSTAWRALVGTADLRMGETVMIHGAGSGVSTVAIQLATHLGARVIATSRSDETLARAATIGADVLINSNSMDLVGAAREATGGRGADVVFDHVGPALFERSIKSLATNGRLVFGGNTTGDTVSFRLQDLYFQGTQLLGLKAQTYHEFRSMLEIFWTTRIEPVIAAELPLAQAAEAHRMLANGNIFGKLILIP